MSPPDRMVQKAKYVSTCAYDGSSAGELTNTQHEWYVSNATLGSRDVIHRLEVDRKIVEQNEERPGRAHNSISDASSIEGRFAYKKM